MVSGSASTFSYVHPGFSHLNSQRMCQMSGRRSLFPKFQHHHRTQVHLQLTGSEPMSEDKKHVYSNIIIYTHVNNSNSAF